MKLSVFILAAFFFSTAAYASDFKLTSLDIAEGKALSSEQVFSGFGCTGGNRSPELRWENAPAATKSFAVMVYDPDAPTGSGWWHWVVFNIPAAVADLPSGAGSQNASALPQGCVQSRTDFGKPGYGGACPPPGDKPHRYVFTVYALDVDRLDLEPDSSPAMVGFFLHSHTLATASITAVYGR
jgi:hypothetical protein